MLSSDQPGEVAAAARAIGKTLKAEGRDWNWLAAKLADDEAPELRPEAAEGPWERREPPPPSEAPRYAEPEQEEAPPPQAGPWGNPPPAPPRRTWLSGDRGRIKQIVAVFGIVYFALGAAWLPKGGRPRDPGGGALALPRLGLT